MGRDPPARDTKGDNTYRFVGYGGTAPSPSLGRLAVATAMASSHRDPRIARVPSGAVAPGDPCVARVAARCTATKDC